jgi:hypothetical protein
MTNLTVEYDGGHIRFNYDPSQYKSAAGNAKALYKAVCQMAADFGQNPEIEVLIQTPEQAEKKGYGKMWRVCWEAGPYEWGIEASGQIRGQWGYAEPYHSFDVSFATN